MIAPRTLGKARDLENDRGYREIADKGVGRSRVGVELK
jgi:hypothetical protein